MMNAYEWMKADLEKALLSGNEYTPRQPIEYSNAGKAMLERAAAEVLCNYNMNCKITYNNDMTVTIYPYLEHCRGDL